MVPVVWSQQSMQSCALIGCHNLAIAHWLNYTCTLKAMPPDNAIKRPHKVVRIIPVGILYCTVLYCTVLYCTVLYCTVLYCTVMYCTVLYCVLYYTAPHCTACCLSFLLQCRTHPLCGSQGTAQQHRQVHATGESKAHLLCCLLLFLLAGGLPDSSFGRPEDGNTSTGQHNRRYVASSKDTQMCEVAMQYWASCIACCAPVRAA